MENKTLSVEMVNRFMGLANALSPENLHCDGEISRAAARRKEVGLRQSWRALEAEVGRKVTEDEVWAAFLTTPRGR